MINGKIITTIPVVKQQATLYFLEKGTNQFELSLADDNGVLRTLYSGAGGASTTVPTLSQVLDAGNSLDGKELIGNLVVKDSELNGQNYELGATKNSLYYTNKDVSNNTNSYYVSSEGMTQIFSGVDEYDSLHKLGELSVSHRGFTMFTESDGHEQGVRLSAELGGLYYNAHASNMAASLFTVGPSNMHVSVRDNSSTNPTDKVDLIFDGKAGLSGDKVFNITDDKQFVQKKYVDDKIAAVGMGGSTSIDAYTKAETDAKINNIVVGGNNLVKNSSIPLFSPNSSDTGDRVVMKDSTGYFVRYTPASDKTVGLYGFRVPESNLGNHTRSIEVRHGHTGNMTIWGQIVPPNKWIRLVQEKFTSPIEFASIDTDVVGVPLDIRKYKIELGTKATDWTPHIDEFSTATSSRKIDEVFTINEEGIFTIQRYGNVVITGVPYAKYIAIVLEMYIIFIDGVVSKIENLQYNSEGELLFPAGLASRDVVTKFYLKALIK